MTNYSRSVLKSNGLHRPKIRLKKFGFSPKIVPANISKKLPAQVLSQIVFHPVFQPLAQMAHVCLHSESGYTLGFRRKIAHNGSHGETRGVSDGGWYHYPRTVPHVHQHPRAGYQNGKLCRFWVLVGGASEGRRKSAGQQCAYARRCSEASRPRWAARSCRYCVNDKKYDQSVGWFIFDFLLGKCKFYQKGCFTALLIRRNRWLPIFQPHLVDFWRAFW